MNNLESFTRHEKVIANVYVDYFVDMSTCRQ